jgi:hypothetical protein
MIIWAESSFRLSTGADKFTAAVKGVRFEAARLLPLRMFFHKATKGELEDV